MQFDRPALDPMTTFNWGFRADSVTARPKSQSKPRAKPRRAEARRAAPAQPCTDGELARLADVLRPLSDRQLQVLGLDRTTLHDDLAEMAMIREGLETPQALPEGLYARLSARLAA